MRGLTQQMSYQASHDALTGLANRREFERRVQESLEARHAQFGPPRALLPRSRSLQGRQRLVRSLGRRQHAARGRCAHQGHGPRLGHGGAPGRRRVRAAARGLPARESAADRRRRRAARSTTTASSGRTRSSRSASASVWSRSRARAARSRKCISAADSACYVAKKQGNHVHVYSARDEAAARHRGEIQWLQRLQTALKDDRFELMMQPIVATSQYDAATVRRSKCCCDCRTTRCPAASRPRNSCARRSAIA